MHNHDETTSMIRDPRYLVANRVPFIVILLWLWQEFDPFHDAVERRNFRGSMASKMILLNVQYVLQNIKNFKTHSKMYEHLSPEKGCTQGKNEYNLEHFLPGTWGLNLLFVKDNYHSCCCVWCRSSVSAGSSFFGKHSELKNNDW